MPLPAIARKRAIVEPVAVYKAFDLTTYTVDNNGACNERLDGDIYINNSGSVDRRRENYGSSSQITVDEYATILTAGFGDDYHGKLTPVSSSSYFDATGSDALSTWHALTSNRVWHFDYQDCSNLVTQDYTLALSDDGGSTTLDTIVFTVRFEHDTP